MFRSLTIACHRYSVAFALGAILQPFIALWYSDELKSQEPRAIRGDQGEGIPADIADAIDGLRRAVAGMPVERAWSTFVDSIAADFAEVRAGKASAGKERELVRRLEGTVERLRTTLALPGIGPIADDVAILTNRLERRVAVLSAAMKVLDRPNIPETLRDDVHRLLDELDLYDLDGDPNRARTVSEISSHLRRSNDPDSVALAEAVNTYYNHYNVRGIISGDLLNRLANDTRTESGPVRDFILGADVFGHQTTNARVGARLVPNARVASFVLEVRGTSHAETQISPRQQGGSVVICSRSVSDFAAERRVDIDTDGLHAGNPVVSANTTNQVVGASTQFSGVPLLGSIGQSIAMSAAEGRRAEAEAIGASRVRDRVLPQFAAESADRIENLNSRYRSRIVDRLMQRNAFPEILNFSSSATHLFAFGRTGRHDELAAHEPLLWLPGDSQVTIQLHESAINNAMAHGDMAGRKIDENSIARLTGEADTEMENSDTPEPESDSVITIELSDKDPVRVRFENGVVDVHLNAAVIRRDEERLLNHLVSVRYAFEPRQGTVRVVREGDIELRPLSGQEDSQPELVSRLRDSLELIFLPEFEVGAAPRLADRAGRSVPLSLAELKLRDGWLSLSFR